MCKSGFTSLGAILVPSAGSGILLGGYIIKRLRLNMTGCAKTALLSSLLSLMLFISVFFITCEMGSIVGVNTFVTDPVTGRWVHRIVTVKQ